MENVLYVRNGSRNADKRQEVGLQQKQSQHESHEKQIVVMKQSCVIFHWLVGQYKSNISNLIRIQTSMSK